MLIEEEKELLKTILNYRSKYSDENNKGNELSESLIFSQNNLSFKFIQNINLE